MDGPEQVEAAVEAPVVEAPTVEQAPVVEAPTVEQAPVVEVRVVEAPAVGAPAADWLASMPETAPDGSQLLHQRGPGRTRRGILCVGSTWNNPPPGTKQMPDWGKGREPWKGVVSQNVGLVNCPACLAARDGRAGGDGAAGAAGPAVEAERPKAAETAEAAKPTIMATADEVAELAASIVVGGLFLLAQGEARLVKADPDLVKGVTGLTSPFLAPAEGTAAWPAFKAWTAYLKKLIAQAGGELPAWVACIVATVPMVGAVAMLKGTRQEVTA